MNTKPSKQTFVNSEAANGGALYKKLLYNVLAIFTGKHCVKSPFNKVVALKVGYFIKKRLQQRCFLVNIAKFLGAPILKNSCFCTLSVN